MFSPEAASHTVRNVVAAILILGQTSLPAPAQQADRSVESAPALLGLVQGEASFLAVEAPFDTVVVGDPSIVTTSVVSATRFVLTARAPGRTNIILLDADGRLQKQWDVLVTEENRHRATVYRGATFTVLSCDPVCGPIQSLEGSNP